VLSAAGIEVVKIPPRSPAGERLCRALGAHARAEVTDRLLIAGSRHLRAVLNEHVAHYNRHRPHGARNLRPPDCADITAVAVTDLTTAKIRRRKVLGGLIREYERAA
jgi:putative transposase